MVRKSGGSVRVDRWWRSSAPGGGSAGALRIWAATTAALALLGPPAGLLWATISPDVRYVVVDKAAVFADPETQVLIGIDGRFAVITAVAGILCGIAAYAAGGRQRDIALVLGLAAGGVVATVLAWRVGHLVGLDTFQRLTRTAPTGTELTGVADLRARGILVFWPVLAVGTYGVLEALDVAARVPPLVPGDAGGAGSGQPDEVGGSELDLQAAPAGGDIDGGETGR
jgi:hypothetical protein